jgi:hypothetical protein
MIGVYIDENKKDLINEIKQSDRRIKEKKQQIEDLQNELDLLKEQGFDTCKRRIMHFGFQNPDITEKAIKWLNMVETGLDSDGNKLDNRKKYDEKLRYEWLNKDIQEILNDDTITIDKIIRFGVHIEAYEYMFMYNNKKHYIQIPVIARVPFEDYDRYGVEYAFGISVHVFTSDHASEYIGGSIFMDEIKDIWKKYTENPKEVIGDDSEDPISM